MTVLPIRRIFVMGCSRSGTTLLQGLLASHSRVHTFPETGVFLKALGMRGVVLPWTRLGFTMGKERKALARVLDSQTKAPGGLPLLPPRRLSLSRSISDGVKFLDALAEAHGKEVWVEKTPRHVLHAREIGRLVPGSVCIHVVRKGEDVVASVVDRARKYPDRFPRQSDPAYGIRQWNRSLLATSKAMGEPGHAVVFYQRLVSELEVTLHALCEITGLPFESEMLTPADRSSFAGGDEAWKSRVNQPVEPAASKFESLFDADAQLRIAALLRSDLCDDLSRRARKAPGGILVSGGD